ncbi:DUF3455 domain-containing protein [Methylovulum psychrotolerans]|jgi:hypothetical protein|uniref:DUF3455 domain-containing protein n=1 Tax=Methylovulum psychrotolerans TaxID=1704499 RepID=A0A2S5CS18_9GAMM|nr:DUF3455 domain-containing protein [Methylovulum psychrotolerans]POZ53576.1 hypothetical protein AADEFJLK_00604 [Methylovulum psychrotolerans]
MLRMLLLGTLLLAGTAFAECQGPAAIKPPVGHEAFGAAHAQGEQVYQCTFSQGQYAWQYLAPEAVLRNNQGQVIGKHFAGPTWEAADGSKVTGKVLEKLDVSPDTSVPWLLLEAVGHEGKGLLAQTRFITRIKTVGGLPPVSGCNSNHLGSEKRVAYTADYVFFKAR